MSSLSSSAPSPAWLTELQSLLLNTATVQECLDELARLTVQELPEGSSCGVTVRQHGWPLTLASSDALTRRIDQLQCDHGEGPCLDALSSGVPNYVVDTATEQRWPSFCRDAHAQGVRSCLSLPLDSPTGVLGAYNLYSTHLDGFSENMWAAVGGVGGHRRWCTGHRREAGRSDAAVRRSASRIDVTVGGRPGHRDHHGPAAL